MDAENSIQGAQAVVAAELVQYAEGSVVSRTIVDSEHTTLTLFAFDQGQSLSEHTAPFDAYVLVLDGRTELTIGAEEVPACAGEMVLMPANVPHGVRAPERFKMLLVMVRS